MQLRLLSKRHARRHEAQLTRARANVRHVPSSVPGSRGTATPKPCPKPRGTSKIEVLRHESYRCIQRSCEIHQNTAQKSFTGVSTKFRRSFIVETLSKLWVFRKVCGVAPEFQRRNSLSFNTSFNKSFGPAACCVFRFPTQFCAKCMRSISPNLRITNTTLHHRLI